MRYTLYVKKGDVPQLEFEVVPQGLRVYLTRVLDRTLSDYEDDSTRIIWQNRFINRARNLLGLRVHVLESDDSGYFHAADYAWHEGECEIMLRRLNIVQFV